MASLSAAGTLVAAAISGSLSVKSEAVPNTRVAVIGAGASVRKCRFVCAACFADGQLAE